MDEDVQWAEYARIQAAASRATSINRSDAYDVRLDRIVDTVGDAEDVERAVRSAARKERDRQLARVLTPQAFEPGDVPDPEQALIWRDAWTAFCTGIPAGDRLVLIGRETTVRQRPTTGAERTRLSRIRSSNAYRKVRADTFPRI
ncbi:hypothetical protein [Rhizobium gallicum]|uniref:hypothetical protein n=1 Tax=Rhizobium gallicum TaxID=56730 RepID=UPI000587EAE2|nr:hypothetical protein [Rhizobium gallicum]